LTTLAAKRAGTNGFYPSCLTTPGNRNFFKSENSEKVETMTSMAGKLTLVIAAAGSLSIVALSPASVEAGVIGRPMLAAASETSDIVRVVCDRRLSNLWSCNDDPVIWDRRDMRVQERRVQSPTRYAAHPCDHSYETARDGSRCGNRAADRRPGGR
jgi:hypothetical protein